MKQLVLVAILTLFSFSSNAQAIAFAGGYESHFAMPSVGFGLGMGSVLMTLNIAFNDDLTTGCLEFDTPFGLDIGNSGIFLGFGGGIITRDDLATNESGGGFIGKLNFRVPINSNINLKYSLGGVWPNEYSSQEEGISHYFGLILILN